MTGVDDTVEGRATGPSSTTESTTRSRDFSENKLRDASLDTQIFEAAFHNSPDSLSLSRVSDGVLLAVSDGFLETTGWKRDEVIGRTTVDIGLWVEASCRGDLLSALRREAALSGYRVRFGRKDGSVREGILSARFLGTEPDLVLFSAVRDVTELVTAENALRESEERFVQAFQLMPIGLAISRYSDGTFVEVNEAALRDFRLTRDQVIGKTSRQLAMWSGPDDRARILQILEREGVVQNCEFSIVRADGSSMVYLYSARKVELRGEPHLLSIVVDITEKKAAEGALRKQEEALRRVQKLESLGLLAGGIAHDFNNLLQALLGNLNLMQRRIAPDSPLQARVDNMVLIVRKAENLARQMLVYSGRGKVAAELLDANMLVREMMDLLQVSISKNARLEVNLSEGSAGVKADATQLQQVVLNLMTNASDAIGEGHGVIQVRTFVEAMTGPYAAEEYVLAPQCEGPHFVLEVHDDGAGMSPETLSRIFDPFFSTKAAGRGLGLAALLGILRAHRASLQVWSELGRGTRFRLAFPIAQAGAGRSANEGTLRSSGGSEKLRILLVDDEADVRATSAGMLEAMGFDVVCCDDGVEAVAMIRDQGRFFDLVVIDAVMPRMSGLEAFDVMHRLRPGIRAVLCTGFASVGEEASRAHGFAGFLRKPYSIEDLEVAVRSALAVEPT